jgi:hypothetical protein
MATRKWGEKVPGQVYLAVERPGNPDWEARNPQKGGLFVGSLGIPNQIKQKLVGRFKTRFK